MEFIPKRIQVFWRGSTTYRITQISSIFNGPRNMSTSGINDLTTFGALQSFCSLCKCHLFPQQRKSLLRFSICWPDKWNTSLYWSLTDIWKFVEIIAIPSTPSYFKGSDHRINGNYSQNHQALTGFYTCWRDYSILLFSVEPCEEFSGIFFRDSTFQALDGLHYWHQCNLFRKQIVFTQVFHLLTA